VTSLKTQSRCPTGSDGARECGTSAPVWLLPWALCGYVGGTALQLQQRALWPWPLYMLGLLLAVGLWWSVHRRPLCWRRVGVCLAAALLAVGWCGVRATVFLAHALDPAWEGRDVRITARVAAMPQWQDGNLHLRLAVETAQGVEDVHASVRLPPLVDVAWYASGFRGGKRAPLPSVHAGERWQFTVRLKAPHGARNPHGFDYELWLWEQGVQATGYVRDGARDTPPTRLGSTWWHPVEQARERVRDAIAQRFARSNDVRYLRAAGVVAALVTGDQRAIARADWQVFRTTGVAHLVSISGLHISMFAWLAAAVVGRLWHCSAWCCLMLPAPTAALVGGVLLAMAYAVFSGWGVPAQRTVCMLLTVALLRLSGKRWPWPHVWLLAAAVVLVVDPWALLQAGFWLSFVAVAVLFAAAAPDAREGDEPRGWQRMLASILDLLRAQWVITLALTPLTLLLFGQVSIVGFVANAVAIPWTTLAVTPLALAGVLCPPLWDWAAWCAQWQSSGLYWLAAWPWAQAIVPIAPLGIGMVAIVGGWLLALRLPWSVRLLGVPLLLPALFWQPARPAMGQFDVLAVDVGQGQAALVRTAHHSLLYDTGPRYSSRSDAGERVLVPLLQALGERLDTVVLSHGDSDHIGGVHAVHAQQPQAALHGSIEAVHPLHKRYAIAPCAQGQQWEWDGVQFEVLHPPPWYVAPNRNAQSCVVRITAAPDARGGTVAALLTGDIERAQELALVRAAKDGDITLTANMLLVPHHGSKTSSSAVFLDTVQPGVAVVQAGYRNRFGHPATPVLQRYAQRDIAVVQTPACGAATWQSSQPNNVHCQRETRRRYWHHRFVLPTEMKRTP